MRNNGGGFSQLTISVTRSGALAKRAGRWQTKQATVIIFCVLTRASIGRAAQRQTHHAATARRRQHRAAASASLAAAKWRMASRRRGAAAAARQLALATITLWRGIGESMVINLVKENSQRIVAYQYEENGLQLMKWRNENMA